MRHLSRSKASAKGVPTFQWNVADRTVDPRALLDVDHIVHLAGAGIADERWCKKRVRELIASRADTSRLLLERCVEAGVVPKSFVSAAGIGYYGAATTSRVFTEDDPTGADTIARISAEWEKAVDEWTALCRVVKLRTPVVLSAEGGALPRMAAPFRWGLGAALGTGKQWMPWVHIDDLVRTYQLAIASEEMMGAYNVVGGNATNAEVTRAVGRAVKKPLWLPNVPGFVFRLTMGEMSSILLGGSRVANERITSTGFQFAHQDIGTTVNELLA